MELRLQQEQQLNVDSGNPVETADKRQCSVLDAASRAALLQCEKRWMLSLTELETVSRSLLARLADDAWGSLVQQHEEVCRLLERLAEMRDDTAILAQHLSDVSARAQSKDAVIQQLHHTLEVTKDDARRSGEEAAHLRLASQHVQSRIVDLAQRALNAEKAKQTMQRRLEEATGMNSAISEELREARIALQNAQQREQLATQAHEKEVQVLRREMDQHQELYASLMRRAADGSHHGFSSAAAVKSMQATHRREVELLKAHIEQSREVSAKLADQLDAALLDAATARGALSEARERHAKDLAALRTSEPGRGESIKEDRERMRDESPVTRLSGDPLAAARLHVTPQKHSEPCGIMAPDTAPTEQLPVASSAAVPDYALLRAAFELERHHWEAQRREAHRSREESLMGIRAEARRLAELVETSRVTAAEAQAERKSLARELELRDRACRDAERVRDALQLRCMELEADHRDLIRANAMQAAELKSVRYQLNRQLSRQP